MTLRTFDMEGVDGASLVQANATTVGTGSAIHSAAAAVVGGTGAHFAASAGQVRSIRCTPPASSLTMATSGYVSTPAATPAVNVTIATLRTSTTVIRILYTPAGVLQVQPNSGANITIASGLGLNVKLRLEILVVIATATTGSITAKAYSSAAGWTTLLGTATSTTADLGTTAVDQSDWGAITATTPGMIVDVDYVRMNDGGTAEFGPPPSASAPTASAGASQDVVTGTQITLDASGSTAGSGTLTYAWTTVSTPPGAASPSISAPTAANPTVVLASQGWYVFQVVVTQTGGLTDTATVTEYVFPPSNTDVLLRSVGATTYTNEGGQVSLLAALNDASSGTYALSPPDPVAAVLPTVGNPVGPGAISAFVDGNWTGGAINRTVEVKDPSNTVLVSTTYALTSVEVVREVPIPGSESLTAVQRRGLQVIVTDSV